MRKALELAGGIIIYIYIGLGTFIFFPYYNWQYANTHGFIAWVFFGEVIATGDSLIWPYFLYKDHIEPRRADEKSSVDHVSAAIDYRNKATEIVDKSGLSMNQADWDTIIEYYKKALAEADQANISEMNKYHAGFGDHFRDEFITGLRSIVDDSDKTGADRAAGFIRGQVLMDKFGDWYVANLRQK